ncbi:hypothetical protein BH23GEM10_BH23GEM10_10910 [soil metagenome]
MLALSRATRENCGMPDERDSDTTVRRYNDQEVRLLLKRAAHAQPIHARTDPASAQSSAGLTLAQLEDVAAEAGIDVALLQQAARELEAQRAMLPAGPVERLAGAPLRILMERTLPFEADLARMGTLIDSIGSVLTDAGEPRMVGNAFSWQASAASGRRTEVRVIVSAGRTRVRVEERYSELAGGLFGGVMGGVGGGVGIGGGTAIAGTLGSAALMVALPVAVIAGTYAACRVGYRAYVRGRARALGSVCDRIVQDLTAWHDAQ